MRKNSSSGGPKKNGGYVMERGRVRRAPSKGPIDGGGGPPTEQSRLMERSRQELLANLVTNIEILRQKVEELAFVNSPSVKQLVAADAKVVGAIYTVDKNLEGRR